MKKRNYIILIAALFSCGAVTLRAQEIKVEKVVKESTIVDAAGQPIVGAAVYGNEGSVRAITDATGHFSIKVDPKSNLLIEANGYEPKVISLTDDEKEVKLIESDFLFGTKDVINIPFGTMKKGEAVSDIWVINVPEVLKTDYCSNVAQLLINKVPGLSGMSNAGFMSTMPVIVDGLQRDYTTLNVEEIEQITVLKDGNASVMYGTQSPLGLILITTKRGQAHKRTINLSVEQSLLVSRPLPKYLNSVDYMTLYSEGQTNDGIAESELKYPTSLIDKYRSGENPYRYPDLDYFSGDFTQKYAATTRAIGEFSGGNERTQYYTNFSWLHEGSFLKSDNEFRNQFNIRGNVNFAINDYLSSYVDAAVNFDFDRNSVSNFWYQATNWRPNAYSPFLPVSSILAGSDAAETANAAKQFGGKIYGINQEYYSASGGGQYSNIYSAFNTGAYREKIDRTVDLNLGLKLNMDMVTKGLDFRVNFSMQLNNLYYQYLSNKFALYEPTWGDASKGEDPNTIYALKTFSEDYKSGTQSVSDGFFRRRVGMDFIFNYNRTFNHDHNVSATLAGNYYTSKYNAQLLADKNTTVGLRALYNYKRRYFANLSAAYSYSPKFAEGKRSAISPSLGLGWVITNEEFFPQVEFLDYLKIKASAALTNSDLGMEHYLYLDSYKYNGQMVWGDDQYKGSLTEVSYLGNPDLTYQKIYSYNGGVEAYLFNKSLFVEASYYYNLISGIIMQRTSYYPSYTGGVYPYVNYGEESFSGVSLSLGYTKQLGEFTLGLNGVFSYQKSKNIKVDNIYANRTGAPGDGLFGLVSDGLYQESDFENGKLISGLSTPQYGTVQPGDIKYKDLNKDGVINDSDNKLIGNSYPSYLFGLTADLKYKDFTLTVVANGAAGYDGIYNGSYYYATGETKYSEKMWNRWTPETAATATLPRISAGANTHNKKTSSFWIEDASFLTLARMQLTYNLPRKVLGNGVLKDVMVFARGSNLGTLTKNAQDRMMNIAGSSYRSYSLGVKVMF